MQDDNRKEKKDVLPPTPAEMELGEGKAPAPAEVDAEGARSPIKEIAQALEEKGEVELILDEQQAGELVKIAVEQLFKGDKLKAEPGEFKVSINGKNGEVAIKGQLKIVEPATVPVEASAVFRKDKQGQLKLHKLELTTKSREPKQKQLVKTAKTTVQGELQDPAEVLRDGLNPELEKQNVRAEQLTLKFQNEKLVLKAKGGIKAGVVYEAPGEAKSDAKRLEEAREELKKVAQSEEEKLAEVFKPWLESAGAKEPELASQIVAKAVTTIFREIRTGKEETGFKSLEFLRQFKDMQKLLEKPKGRQLSPNEEKEEKVSFIDILKALLELIMIYIKRMIQEQFAEQLEAKGIKLETEEQIMEFFRNPEGYLGEEAEAPGRGEAKTAQELDYQGDERKAALFELLVLEDLGNEEVKRIWNKINQFVDLLVRKEQGGALTAAEKKNLILWKNQLRSDLGDEALKTLSGLERRLMAQARKGGRKTPEEIWEWMFGEAQEGGRKMKAAENVAEERPLPPAEPVTPNLPAEETPPPAPEAEVMVVEAKALLMQVEAAGDREEMQKLAKRINSAFGNATQEGLDLQIQLALLARALDGYKKELRQILSQHKDQAKLSSGAAGRVEEIKHGYRTQMTGLESAIRVKEDHLRSDQNRKKIDRNKQEEMTVLPKYESGRLLMIVRSFLDKDEDRRAKIDRFVPIEEEAEVLKKLQPINEKFKELEQDLTALLEREKIPGLSDLQKEPILRECEVAHQLIINQSRAWENLIGPYIELENKAHPGIHGEFYIELYQKLQGLRKKRKWDDGDEAERSPFEILKYSEQRKKLRKAKEKVERLGAGATGADQLMAKKFDVLAEAEDEIDEYFNEMLSQAETDPLSFWDLREYMPILNPFLKDMARISDDLFREYDTRWQARRFFHNNYSQIDQNLTELTKHAATYGTKKVRTSLTRSVRGFGTAEKVLDQEMSVILQDPRLGRELANFMLDMEYEHREEEVPPGEGVKTLVGRVTDRLIEMSEAELVEYRGRKVKLDQKGAFNLAMMALKVSAADMRAAEWVCESKLPERSSGEPGLRSAKYKEIAQAMNPLKELFRRFGLRGESPEVIARQVEETDTNAQPGMWTRTDQNEEMGNVNPRRLTRWSSIISNWRTKEQASARIRGLDLALGVQIAGLQDKEKGRRKGETTALWQKTARRMPSLMATYFPTLSWEWQGISGRSELKNGEYALHEYGEDGSRHLTWTRHRKKINKNGEEEGRVIREAQRMRESVFEDRESAKALRAYAQARAFISAEYQGHLEGIEEDERPYVIREEARVAGIQTKKPRTDSVINEKEGERRRERWGELLGHKEERQRAFVWRLGEVYEDELRAAGIVRPEPISVPVQEEGEDDDKYKARRLKKMRQEAISWDKWENQVFEKWDSTDGLRMKLQKLEQFNFLSYKEKILALDERFQAEFGRRFDKDDPVLESEVGAGWEFKEEYERLVGEYDTLGTIEKLRQNQEERRLAQERRAEERRLALGRGERVPEEREEGMPEELVIAGLRGEDFSEADVRLTKQLTYLGEKEKNENEEEEYEGARQLAEQQLTQSPFEDDFDSTLMEYEVVGEDGLYSRRYNDGNFCSQALTPLVDLFNELSTFRDKAGNKLTYREIIKKLTEHRNGLQHIDLEERQEIIRVWGMQLIKDFFKADSWVEYGPGGDWHVGPVGLNFLKAGLGPIKDLRIPLLGRIAKSSSPAQRRIGDESPSMTKGEVYRFVREFSQVIGHKQLHELDKYLQARTRDIVTSYVRQYGLLVLTGYGGYSSFELMKVFFSDILKASLKAEVGD